MAGKTVNLIVEAVKIAGPTHLDGRRIFKYPCDEPLVVSSVRLKGNGLGAITVILLSGATQAFGKPEVIVGNVPELVGNVDAVFLDVSFAPIDNFYIGMVSNGLCGSQKLRKAQDGEH